MTVANVLLPRDEPFNVYPYDPSHVLPPIFAALVGISLFIHIYQNTIYKFWRTTFWICWGGSVFTTGWILRTISSYHDHNLNLYIAQTVFIYAGPPIYAASAYNIVGRLLHYLPMHSPLNPNRVVIFYIYLGALVEALTAAGAARMAVAGSRLDLYLSAGKLIAAATVIQAAIEFTVIMIVATVHRRAARAKMCPPNVRLLCITLYGTSTLVMLRCIFRAVEAFDMFSDVSCIGRCGVIANHEWFLFALEAAPMVIFTWWLNAMHPGRFLPRNRNRYLDLDGRTERVGPGWRDTRTQLESFVDPFDLMGAWRKKASYDEFWNNGEEWPAAEDSFARGDATNVLWKQKRRVSKVSVESPVRGRGSV